MDDQASSSTKADPGQLSPEEELEEDSFSQLDESESEYDEDEVGDSSEYDESIGNPEIKPEVVVEENYLCDDVTEKEMNICGESNSCSEALQHSAPVLRRSGSPIYTTVEPAALRRSKSFSHDVEATGTVSNTSAMCGSGVVSYTSTMALSGQGVKSTSLDWLPRVPKKQRCVQVSVMDEDFRTPKREMLFVDIEGVNKDNRGLIFVDTAGEMVYRTCFDKTSGAYGVVLENPAIRSAESAGSKRIVGCIFNTLSTSHKDEWQLRDAETGDVNAVIKLGKWQGFVKGCMHVTRGETLAKTGADIRIRRLRGSSDFIVEAELNGQVITTIRRGAGRGSALDHNIFSLFVAPYIDSVAIVSLFTCLMHIQLRHERPRTTGNIIGMLLAKEARQTGREIKAFTVEKTGVLGKVVKKNVKKGMKASGLSEAKVFTTARNITIGRIHSRPNTVTVTIPDSPFTSKTFKVGRDVKDGEKPEKQSTSKQTSVESSFSMADAEKVYIKVAKSAEKSLYALSDHAEAGAMSLTKGAQSLVKTLKEKQAEIRVRAAAQLATVEARG